MPKKDNQGFTIIEVLIVLAIAGLIMIIVFLAVPALQRNNRNQNYRTEANNLSSAYQEVSANKAGAVLPAGVSDPTHTGPSINDADRVISAANSKHIATVTIEAAGGTTVPANDTYDTVVIRTASKCTAADSATTASGSMRQIALLYNVETTGGSQVQCINS